MNLASAGGFTPLASATIVPACGNWRFSAVHEADASTVRDFMRASFHAAYGARIRHFLPHVMALYRDDSLMAACALRYAADEALFLEKYLDDAVEKVLPHNGSTPVERRLVVEVGNLSIARPGATRHLIAHLTAYLEARGLEWTVFTAVPALRNNFVRLGIPHYTLGNAEVGRIRAEEREAWGRYYEQRPTVCAVHVRAAHLALLP